MVLAFANEVPTLTFTPDFRSGAAPSAAPFFIAILPDFTGI